MAKMGSILITGANGFLGAWLTAYLLGRGERVTLFDKAGERPLLVRLIGREPAQEVDCVTGDITDAHDVEAAFDHSQAHAVIHLAALTIPACRRNPSLGAGVNIVGHINVLEAARRRGLKKIIYTSSIAALPRGKLQAPVNIYGVTKRAAEEISKVYFIEHGLPSIGLRPNVVYGYGRIGGETADISEAIRSVAERKPYTMTIGGRMCFQHVDEIVDVMTRCLVADPTAPIISDITTNIESTDDVIAAICKAEPSAKIQPANSSRPAPDVALNNAPLKALIGTWPSIPLQEGVKRTLMRYRL